MSRSAAVSERVARSVPQAGSARRPGLFRALRSEALKSSHGAPVKVAIALALPFPLLFGPLSGRFGMSAGLSFSAWNYYYVLLLPVALTLISACVANYDARLRGHVPLSSPAPLGRAWWAKALWCLALSALSNACVLAVYLVGAVVNPGGPSVPAMASAAVTSVIATSWMIPVTLFLVCRVGMLAGVLGPLAVQIGGGFAWSAVGGLWWALPPAASVIMPSAFLPVLPTAEPLSASPELAAAIGSFGPVQAAALAVCAAVFVMLTVVGAVWFRGSEEL